MDKDRIADMLALVAREMNAGTAAHHSKMTQSQLDARVTIASAFFQLSYAFRTGELA